MYCKLVRDTFLIWKISIVISFRLFLTVISSTKDFFLNTILVKSLEISLQLKHYHCSKRAKCGINM